MMLILALIFLLIIFTLLKLFKYLPIVTVYLYKILTIKIIIAFHIIIFMSIFMIIIFIVILKIFNIKILFKSNYNVFFFNNPKFNKNIKIKNNISLECSLILILTITFFLNIEVFLLAYFFLDSLFSNIAYLLISLFLLFQVKLILQIIYLPFKNYFYNIIILINKKIIVILPFISMTYLIYSFVKNIKYIYIKTVFIIEKINNCIIYFKTISFLYWIFILIIVIISYLFINFISKKKINKLFAKIYTHKFESILIKFIWSIKNYNFKFYSYNLTKSTVIVKPNNFKPIKIFYLIKNLILLIFNYFIDINFKSLFGLKIEFLKLFEDINTTSSDEENNDLQEINSPLNFENFNNVLSIEQNNYIHNKMIDKGIDPNQPLIDMFISATLKNTNGTQLEVDLFVEKNLNIILKNQREAQLNTHGFYRFKPFLIHKTNQEPNNFPTVIPISKLIPISKVISEYETQEPIDDINKKKEEINNNSSKTLSSNEFENEPLI